MDKRQIKSRQAIFKAFTGLLSEKRFSKITVQDILDRGHVSRSTFYAHFPTKDALLDEMIREIFEHVFAKVQVSEENHDFSEADGGLENKVLHILYHLGEYDEKILPLINSESGELFIASLDKYLREFCAEEVLDKRMRKNANVGDEFLLNHVSSAFVAMVKMWFKDNLRESPEKMAREYAAVTLPIL